MTVLQKAIAILAVIATLAVVAMFGVRQYGNARVAAQELGTVKEAVSEAVAERKEAMKADAQAGAQKAVALDSVRTAGNLARKELHAQAVQEGAGCWGVSDADVLVFNHFIHEANRVISASR